MDNTTQPPWPVNLLWVPLLLLLSSVSFSQTGESDLENSVRSHIEDYYTQPFTIRADENGVITVMGEVNTLFDKLEVGELVSEVLGVQGVVNNIFVLNKISADMEIQSNIERELERNDAILEPAKIKVDVKQGVVYLSGSVSFYREKRIAQSIASWQDGVSDIVSTIVVLSPAAARSDQNLKEMIGDLLERAFPLEKHVLYTVHDGEVLLSGTVRDLWAKNHIEEQVQHLLGVHSVINTLEVQKHRN
jgi:osmotically-inducible protein OsmY